MWVCRQWGSGGEVRMCEGGRGGGWGSGWACQGARGSGMECEGVRV